MAQDPISEKISQIFVKWNHAEAQRTIYGSKMPQTKQAINDLFKALTKAFSVIKIFSLIRKDKSFAVAIKTSTADEKFLRIEDTQANVPSFRRWFMRLNIDSIAFCSGLSRDELGIFFNVLDISDKFLKEQGGIKVIFIKNGIKHLLVNQMRFQLLSENERVSTCDIEIPSSDELAPEELFRLEKLKKPDKKIFDSAWKDYLEGKSTRENFESSEQEFIKLAKEKPAELTKLIKRMASKQKDVENFLANLEQKLFNLGFPTKAIDKLKNKLLAPKKVSIREDELARLRKIESEYQQSLDMRVNGSIETVAAIKKRLNDEKERTDAILRQVSQGALVLDKNGAILALNPVAQKVLGVSSKEVQGKLLKDVIREHHMLSMVSRWQDETAGHTPKKVEVHSLNQATADTVRESSVVVEDENGKPIGVVSSLQNVVEHQEMEKRKNDILDVLGHDLRTPIITARESLYLLMGDEGLPGKLSQEQQKLFTICERNMERTEKMVNKILDTRRLETGKVILKKEVIDIKKIVEESIQSLKSWANNKNISFDLKVGALPDIEADPERIYQVITNLISNALKFTLEKGSIKVKGEVIQEDSMEFIKISVADSGTGIKKEDITRIFTKYEQVSFEAPKGVSGLGLGLTICKSIVELHDGKIWAESETGKGSTFVFKIPVKDSKLE